MIDNRVRVRVRVSGQNTTKNQQLFGVKTKTENNKRKRDKVHHTSNSYNQFSKTPLFSARFSRDWLYKKQKKSLKDQKNFCSNTFFKVFANYVSVHFKI